MAPGDRGSGGGGGGGGGGGLRKIVLGGMLLTLSLLLLSLYPVCGDNPSYRECQPHIDATIRNLAAKAIVAGETPSEDINIDDYAIENEVEELQEPEAPEEPEEPEVEEPEEEPEPVVEVPEVEEEEEEEEVEEEQVVDEEEEEEEEEPEPEPEAAPEEEEPEEEEEPAEPEPPKKVEPQEPKKEKLAKPSPEPSPKKPAAPAPAPAAAAPTGIIDKLVKVIFGLPTAKRDPKYAQPWQTFPEFKKAPAPEAPAGPKKVEVTSGIIDKFVSMIFGSVSGKRDPKWAEPWQSHKEHKKQPVKEAEAEEKTVKYGAMGGPIDKLVRLIFPVQEVKQRDPKWSQPWQTHPEFARKAEAKQEAKAKEDKPVIHGAMGGPLDKFVKLVFETTKEGTPRDPKWAQPWQTHPEFARKTEAKEEAKAKAKDDKPVIHGAMGGPLDKFVKLVFETTKEGTPRDPKWAQPWQTHPEFARKAEAKQEAKEEKVTKQGAMGGPLDKLVKMIFETTKEGTPRDPKWAQPWQTHKEHLKAKPASADKPVPAAKPAPAPKVEPAPKPAAAPKPVAAPKPAPKPEPAAKPAPAPKPAAAPAQKPAPKPEPKAEPAPKPAAAPKPEPKPEPAAKPKPAPEPVAAPKPKPEEPKTTFPAEGPGGAPAAAPADAPPKPDGTKAPRKPVLEQEEPKTPPPPPSLPKEEEQLVVVPSAMRSRDRLEAILGLDEVSKDAAARTNPIADATLKELKKIYENTIIPLETLYKYQDISNRHVSDAELFGTPLVLLVGPYSTGKSSFINYLLGIEHTKRALKTGTPPSHGVFRVIQHGKTDAELGGTALSAQWFFTTLQKFGQNFVDQLQGRAMDVPLLKKVTFVEAPGILEMRRPGERLYPFNDVVQWFIDRADLILVMFDYTKLDAGYELEAVLDQLKGREAQTRILLNKADQVPAEELIKVQGSLFWNLSPLLGVSSPPTVYAGSFTSQPYRSGSPAKLFQAQEEALLTDLARAINSRVENRIAIARRHAVRVRNHAQMVDSYLTTFYRNKGFLTSKHKLAEDIIENPHTYNIYEGMSLLTNISRYDLPDPEVYRDFFRVHNLYDFQTLKATCSYFRGCPLTKIDESISSVLPELLERYRRLVDAALAAPASKARGAGPVPAPPVRGNVPAAATARTS